MRKLAGVFMSIAAMVSLVGCSVNTEVAGDSGSDTKEENYKVAIMADGAGFGSQSFNDVALEGLEKAKQDFGIELLTLEVKEVSDYANSLRSLAQQSVDLIIIPSSTAKDAVLEVALEYPDTYFGLLDVSAEGVDNVASASYREEEAAFLLGALGSRLSKTNKIGFIGGSGSTIQDRFQYGFMAGAYAANPETEVVVSYTGSFSDVGKGKEVATMMYSDGCDYIAPTAGACNLGVFQAAQEAGDEKWCFGAANGQFNQMPDEIVASQVKKVDTVAYSMVESLVNGTFEGKSKEYGLKENGVELMYSPEENMKDIVPQEIKEEMEKLRSEIVEGNIEVPGTEEEYQSYIEK